MRNQIIANRTNQQVITLFNEVTKEKITVLECEYDLVYKHLKNYRKVSAVSPDKKTDYISVFDDAIRSFGITDTFGQIHYVTCKKGKLNFEIIEFAKGEYISKKLQ